MNAPSKTPKVAGELAAMDELNTSLSAALAIDAKDAWNTRALTTDTTGD
jgi:hypothetical protein